MAMTRSQMNKMRSSLHPAEFALFLYDQRFPNGNRMVKEYRSWRGDFHHGVGEWPEWCYLPMGYMGRIVAHEWNRSTFTKEDYETTNAVFSAVNTWRVSRGIYRFDPTLAGELVDQELAEFPTEVLKSLPEWCVYIETPFLDKTAGFFAHLDTGKQGDEAELRLLLLRKEGFTGYHFPMCIGMNIDQSIRLADQRLLEESDDVYYYHDPLSEEEIEEFKHKVKPLFNLLLYLCSVNAEYFTKRRPRREVLPNGQAKQAKASSYWKMGYRIGATIRAYQNGQGLEQYDVLERNHTLHSAREHNAPSPHVRRAHWHSFWTGPRDGERELVVKWLPPIPVNVGMDAMLPTLHRVK